MHLSRHNLLEPSKNQNGYSNPELPQGTLKIFRVTKGQNLPTSNWKLK